MSTIGILFTFGALDVTENNKDFINYPVVLTANVRSLIPKIDCVCETLREENVSFGFLSELWLSDKNPMHQRELDRRLSLEGFEFFTNSRAARRGGGVGIVVNKNLGYTGKRLQVNCRVGASSLEIVKGIKNFICASIYCPPRSKTNDLMIEHIQFNLNSLTALYPGAGIYLGGDINNLDCSRLCNTFPDMVNIVASPTRGEKILDVIVTNLHTAYDKAIILPPIQPDAEAPGLRYGHFLIFLVRL